MPKEVTVPFQFFVLLRDYLAQAKDSKKTARNRLLTGEKQAGAQK